MRQPKQAVAGTPQRDAIVVRNKTEGPPERAQRRSRQADLSRKPGTNPAPSANTDPRAGRCAERDVLSLGPSRPSRALQRALAQIRRRARPRTGRGRPRKSIWREPVADTDRDGGRKLARPRRGLGMKRHIGQAVSKGGRIEPKGKSRSSVNWSSEHASVSMGC
jgi:hypothetical protein